MNRDHLKNIKHRLAAVVREEILLSLLDGLYKFIFIPVTLWLIFVLFEYIWEFGSNGRTLLFILFVAATLSSFIFFILRQAMKFFTAIDYHSTAQKVGKHYSEIKDDLLNAMQLVEETNSNHSPELVDAAFKRVYDKSIDLDFKKIVDFKPVYKSLAAAFGFFTIIFLVLLIMPGLRAAASRLIDYSQEFIPSPQILFDVKPGSVSVTKGENITIRTEVTGKQPEVLTLYWQSTEETEFTERRLTSETPGMFTYEFRNVRSGFQYYVSAENKLSEIFNITVVDRPVISKLELTIVPPAYSALPINFQKDNGNITTLTGSGVTINISSTKQLKSAQLIFGDSTKTSFNVRSYDASVKITVIKDSEYYIALTDASGISNASPIVYSITTIADQLPAIEIVSPEKDVMLTTSNALPLVVSVTDDFGFEKLTLNYRLSVSKYEEPWSEERKQAITINTKLLEQDVHYVWDLSRLVLAEGDAVTYYLEIFDNDNVSGPKSARTQTQTVRVPSIDDLFNEMDNSRDNAEEKLEDVLKDVEELKEEFEKLSNELKQDAEEITWEEKEKIEKAVEKFDEIKGSMEEIQKQISEMQQNAMENNLLSEETMEKYAELQKLMEELSSPEMQEAFKRMQEMLEQLGRNQIQQSFENLQANEEYFQKSIERTINLLKRIQIEQKVDELIKRAEDLEKKLEEALERTEQGNLDDKKTSNELSQRQKDITDNIEKTGDVMSELSELVNQVEEMPADEMRKLMDEFEKQKNESTSEEAEQNIKQNDKPSAMKNQKQLSKNMQSLSQMMKDLQQSIQQQNQMEVMLDMLKIIDNLITVSKDQEALTEETKLLIPSSPDYDAIPKKQNDMIINLDKVTEQMEALSQKTFAITPEMGNAIGNARWQMIQAIGFLQRRQNTTAPQIQKQAMGFVNEAALLMQSAMNQMMSGGQGGGMMSMMQQLQQMSQQQMSLNQMTKMLNQGQLTQQQMAQLQRLANEQALIQKSLQQLDRESKQSGESKKLAGNLEKIIDEMQEVIQKMNSRSIDDNLILKQERILSRLLDAQRSMNERDYEDNRESQSGTNISRQSPGEIDLSTQEARDKLRDELIRALKEGYKKDYENLIRKYFEALEKEQQLK